MALVGEDSEAMLRQAFGLHQQGELAEAEALYNRVLERDPAGFAPRHLLGVLRFRQGRHSEALELIAGALRTNPRDARAQANYAKVLMAMGRAEEALAGYERALAVKPDFPDALYNRGVILANLGRPIEALADFDKLLSLLPDHPGAHFNRGVVLAALTRYEDALQSYDRTLELQPDFAPALGNRGIALWKVGLHDAALESFDRALALSPDDTNSLYNRGLVLADMRRFEDALDAFDRALAIEPDFVLALENRGQAQWNLKHFEAAAADFDTILTLDPGNILALNNRGAVFRLLNRFDEALASCDQAVGRNPDFAAAWANRALILRDMGRYEDALMTYNRALTLEPGNATVWNSRGTLLREMKQPEEALANFDRAAQLKPNFVEALYNRGVLQWAAMERYDAAIADLQQVLALDPDHDYARGELLHVQMYGADWRDYARQKALIDGGVRAGRRVARPFLYQAVSDAPADLQACSRIFAAHRYPPTPMWGHTKREHRKIRLGYLSGEFREQATAYLMAGLYEMHDRDRFEIIAFDNGGSDNSPMRVRLEAAFDRLIDISRLTDRAAAERIHAEEIDILVNLNGYFGLPRMGVFACKPAPIQVNYLGFPATLGAPYIDYILADRTVIPESERRYYTEQVVWLPDTYQVNDSKRPIMEDIPTRAQVGLPDKRPDNGFVFCNFNQSYKLTPGTFAVWSKILMQVDGSVLWLLEGTPRFRENLRREAERSGVSAGRLIFAPVIPTHAHLARLKLGDLFLDSLPYNAHTTASDALWTGLPLLTCRGTAFAGRVAASLLGAAGLPELVTENWQDYERLAVALAGDAARLSDLRERLAQNRLTCALFDTDRFRRNIEAAYLKMWDGWQRGVPAGPLSVP